MAGLKDNFPGVAQGAASGWKITPDEMDMDMQYVVLHPAVSNSYFGTLATASTGTAVISANFADHPRNLLMTVTGVAGGIGGTLVVNYKNQFGGTVQESIGLATVASAGTKAGTGIVAEYLSGTFTAAGVGGTAIATVALGVAVNDESTSNPAIFGLPAKLGAASDIKSVTYLIAGTAAMGDRTLGDTGAHGFKVGATVLAATCYVVRYRSTYNSSGDAQISNS